MKIFQISDLHIGKQFYHYNLREDQQEILDQILSLARREKPGAVLIAGDIYDSSIPSAEAVEIFDKFLTGLYTLPFPPAVFLIAGNHDSPKRLDFASEILSRNRIYIAGMPPRKPEDAIKKVTLQDEYGNINFYLLPYTKPSHIREITKDSRMNTAQALECLIGREEINTKERNVILSHQFYTAGGEKPIESDSEIKSAGGLDQADISILDNFDYAALGHIHRPQKLGRESIRYCGSPLAYSVSEAEGEKSVTMVKLGEKGREPVVTMLGLTPLRRVRRLSGTLKEVLAIAGDTQCDDYVSITLTDEVEAAFPKERLELCYTHILEIIIDNARTRKLLRITGEDVKVPKPFDSFCAFFREMNGRDMEPEETGIVYDVINSCLGRQL